jgi:hypothetical protein
MFSIQPPKFCGGCAAPLGLSRSKVAAVNNTSVSQGKSKKIRSARSRQDLNDDDPDGLEIYEVPSISKLSYSIEKDHNKFSLKDMIPLGEIEQIKENIKKSDES